MVLINGETTYFPTISDCWGSFVPRTRVFLRFTLHNAIVLWAYIFALTSRPAITYSHEVTLLDKPAPSFRVQSLGLITEEESFHAKYNDSIVLVEFWATWCVPCIHSQIHLTALHEGFSSQGLRILALSHEDAKLVNNHLRKHPVPYDVGIVPKKTFRDYGVAGLPHAVLLDKKGIMRWFGDPRDLTAKDIEKFIATEVPPKLRQHTPHYGESLTREPRLIVRIAYVPDAAPGPVVMSHGKSIDSIELNCQAASLQSIIGILLDIGSPRLQVDDELARRCYDIEYYYKATQGQEPSYEPLIDAIKTCLSLEIDNLSEIKSVWIARLAHDRNIRLSENFDEIGPDGDGMHRLQGASTATLFRSIESRHKVFIEDETGLVGKYDFSYPLQVDFSKVRDYLISRYGVVFTQEDRSTSLVAVRSK